MQLPTVIADLVRAQNAADSTSFANCFAETAVVFDEGHTHRGRTEIGGWIAESNRKNSTVMRPISFAEEDTYSVLTAEVSGTFPGSPFVLNYHLEIADQLIQSLRISS